MVLDYNNCPLLFYYRYIAKIHLPTKQIHLVFGGAVHEAIEAMYENKNSEEAFKAKFDKKKLLKEERELYPEYYKLGLEMVKNYQKEHKMLNSLYDLNDGKSEIYFREKVKNPLTSELSSIPLSGRIDRLTTKGRIIEYKTSKNLWNSEDISFKVQTLLYNLWYYTKYNKLPEETLYFILLKKYKKVGKGEVVQVLSNHSTLDELASTFEELKLIIEKIENRQFDRPAGYHPRYCDCYRYSELLNFENRS